MGSRVDDGLGLLDGLPELLYVVVVYYNDTAVLLLALATSSASIKQWQLAA